MASPINADLGGWEVVSRSEHHAIFRPRLETSMRIVWTGVLCLLTSGGLYLYGIRGGWTGWPIHIILWAAALFMFITPFAVRLAIYRDQAAGVARIWARGQFGRTRRVVPLGASEFHIMVTEARQKTQRYGSSVLRGYVWTLHVDGPQPMNLRLTEPVPEDRHMPGDAEDLAKHIMTLLTPARPDPSSSHI
ncbi:MAG TPA: hypothetical protein VNT79_15665 [Phycisphaerae bacterium]|nr:hypothetical protein [Phycisphaerae bacterium]